MCEALGLTAGGAKNVDVNTDFIIFAMQDAKLFILVFTLSTKDNQKI